MMGSSPSFRERAAFCENNTSSILNGEKKGDYWESDCVRPKAVIPCGSGRSAL